jgi:hypothetical protein
VTDPGEQDSGGEEEGKAQEEAAVFCFPQLWIPSDSMDMRRLF